MFRRHYLMFLNIVSLLGIATLARAANPLPAIPPIPNQNLFISQLVRVSDTNNPQGNPILGVFSAPVGSDPLSNGQVAVAGNRQVTFQVRGATPSGVYNPQFCRFGFPIANGCVSLGQFTTDANGDADAPLAFPAGTPDTWTGQFVLLRNTGVLTAEFISGFTFPPAPPAASAGVQLQLMGQIQSLNTSNPSFRLAGLPIDIFTGQSTKFQGGGIHNFADLKVGDVVQVTGFTRPDSTIFATDVRSTPGSNSGGDNGDDNGDSKGKHDN